MTNAEQITLFAIAITFITTLGGWIYTYNSQRNIQDKQKDIQIELAKLNKRFSIEEEHRVRMLKQLDAIEAWFLEGATTVYETMTLLGRRERDKLAATNHLNKIAQWVNFANNHSVNAKSIVMDINDNYLEKNDTPYKNDFLSSAIDIFAIEVGKITRHVTESENKTLEAKDRNSLRNLQMGGIEIINKLRKLYSSHN